MKTLVKNTIVVLVAIIANVFSANAQEVASTIVGTANSKGCFHAAVINGVIHVENCNGFYAAPVVGFSSISYKNEDGTSSTSCAKFGAQVGYRQNAFRPEISAFYSSSMKIEGRSYSAPEVQLALNIDFNRHSKVDFYVAPTIAYKFVKSVKNIDTDKYEMNIPYDGNAFMYGGKVGTMIKIGHPAHANSTIINGKSTKYVSHSQLYIKVEAQYQTGKVSKPAGDKLTTNEIGGNISLVWKF